MAHFTIAPLYEWRSCLSTACQVSKFTEDAPRCNPLAAFAQSRTTLMENPRSSGQVINTLVPTCEEAPAEPYYIYIHLHSWMLRWNCLTGAAGPWIGLQTP